MRKWWSSVMSPIASRRLERRTVAALERIAAALERAYPAEVPTHGERRPITVTRANLGRIGMHQRIVDAGRRQGLDPEQINEKLRASFAPGAKTS